MISFIVPAYNEELWIGTCLDSILSTMKKLEETFEIIVVNDSSTDATPMIARCFLFCTRDAFHATQGFSEQLHAGEDLEFIRSLKKIGRFELLKPLVKTSGRKLAVVGPLEVLGLLASIAIRGPRYENSWVKDILYGERAQKCKHRDNVQ